MSTLHEKMFLAQTTLESWLDSGRAEFDGSVLSLPAQRKTYALEGAAWFEQAVAGTGLDLSGKVMTHQQIGDLGGELMEDSVVFGEHAFIVRAGYVATLQGG